MKSFRKVREYLSEILFINAGGCGIAAYAMYAWLKKHNRLDKDFKFVLCYYGYGDSVYKNNENVLRTKKGNAIACSHIGIEYRGKVIDCNSVIYLPEYTYVQFVNEEWFMLNCINNVKYWNSMFKRSVVPEIAKALGIDLSMIKL